MPPSVFPNSEINFVFLLQQGGGEMEEFIEHKTIFVDRLDEY